MSIGVCASVAVSFVCTRAEGDGVGCRAWMDNAWTAGVTTVTCGQRHDSGALAVPEHAELRQLHFVAHADAHKPVLPVVPNVSHSVPDSGDMPNTQNAITYVAKHRVSLTRPVSPGLAGRARL
ncbi:jg23703 [Pararge aegeria aegeria]|uniref:Jg23703 protein n=1 Tax=Pararge aegeria aegeria TaxID=348720 RepID=A0A8S4QMK8_9NEOP|nr:jg23703 [Pararge aegeria aegeria]